MLHSNCVCLEWFLFVFRENYMMIVLLQSRIFIACVTQTNNNKREGGGLIYRHISHKTKP